MMNKRSRFSPTEKVLSGDTADIYLLHAHEILVSEKIERTVAMEFFGSDDGILCGINEVIALLRSVLGADREVWALEEGQSFSRREVTLRISGLYQEFGIYETAILGILSQESGWATAARRCVDAAQGTPILHFGARHVHPDIAPRLEYAAVVGGCTGCATPAGAQLAGIEPSGTIPHALILCVGDTVEAMQAFDRQVDPEIKRIALVDTFKDEAEESLRVARALGGHLWGVRLDTPAERGRVTPELTHEVRARLDQAGFGHVRIVTSGGVDEARIVEFKNANAPVDAFGVGSAISSASPIDFTADIKQIGSQPVAKRGRIPGITNNKRLTRIL